MSLQEWSWPVERAEEATEAIARECGLFGVLSLDVSLLGTTGDLRDRIMDRSSQIGVEVEEVVSVYADLDETLKNAGPAIIKVPGEDWLVALVRGRGRNLWVLTPKLNRYKLAIDELHATIVQTLEQQIETKVNSIIEAAEIPLSRRDRSRRALFSEHLGEYPIARFWLLRPPVGSSFFGQLRHGGQVKTIAGLSCAHFVQHFLFLFSWLLIGRGALSGNLDKVWIAGWGLLLVTLVPLRMLTVYLQGRVVIGTGALLKRRLLAGVLNFDLEDLKHEGAGMLLGRVIESNSIEALALTGGHVAIVAVIEVCATVWVLSQGAGGLLHGALFCGWAMVTLFVLWRYYALLDSWVTIRLELSHDLTERMVAHRTRLAQQSANQWHEGEDTLVDRYFMASNKVDAIAPYLGQTAFAWRIIGFLGLAPAFLSGNASIASLAVGLGGVILGYQALSRFSLGIGRFAAAGIAWRRVAVMFHAAEGSQDQPSARLGTDDDGGDSIIVARDLSYTFAGRAQPAVSNIDLTINKGDRLLLVGPSGSGKSTLISLLSALRQPDNGVILCHGLDLATLGSVGWRSLVGRPPNKG